MLGWKQPKFMLQTSKQHGWYENIGCLKKDIINHLDKSRRLATAMLECFMLIQEGKSYATDLDDEDRVFWIDVKDKDEY